MEDFTGLLQLNFWEGNRVTQLISTENVKDCCWETHRFGTHFTDGRYNSSLQQACLGGIQHPISTGRCGVTVCIMCHSWSHRAGKPFLHIVHLHWGCLWLGKTQVTKKNNKLQETYTSKKWIFLYVEESIRCNPFSGGRGRVSTLYQFMKQQTRNLVQ